MKLPPWLSRSEKSQRLDVRKLSHFESFLDHAPVNYLLLDSSGVILEINVPAARLLGKESRFLTGLPLRQFIFEADLEQFDRQLDECRRKDGKVSCQLRLCVTGTPSVDFLSSSFHHSSSQNTLLQVIIHENHTNGSHTVGKATNEAEIQRLTRTLKALSRSSQAMMRAVDEKGYMHEVCKIVQEDCGHAMVWIGFAYDDEQKTIRPATHAGFEEGYLENLRLTWAETERGRGPTGSAVRAGKPYLCRNMLTDPCFAPWREEAIRRGYAASIALPLISGSKAFGAITIYSRETDPFSEDEVKLLSELAGDLSYGLTALRLRAAREAAEHSLLESEQRHRALFENMSEGFALFEIITDPHGSPCDYRFLEVNPAFVRLTGLKREDLLGKRVLEVQPDHEPVWIERYGRVALTGEPAHFERFSAPLNRWYEVFAYRPAPLQFAIIFTDITQRKHAEDERREVEERVRRKLQSVLEPEGDLAELDLGDLVDVPAMQKLMDDFYSISHFPMSLVDMKGEVLVGVGWQDICTRFHRVHPETCRLCTESDIQLSAGVPKGEFRLYKCKNHLWDIATPVVVGGRQAGNIFSGQFFFDDEEVNRDLFRNQARQYGFDEGQYLAALERVPRLSRATVDNGMAFLLKLADMLSQLGYSNAKLARLLGERDRLAASLHEEQQRLERSQTKYSTLFNTTSDGVWIHNLKGEIVEVNDAYCLMSGYSRDEILRMPVSKLDANETPTQIVDHIQKVIDSGGHDRFESRHRRKDGSLFDVDVTALYYDMDGGRMAIFVRDITERKRAEEAIRLSEEKFGLAFANNPSAIALTRLEDGLYYDVNDTWARLLGYSREEAIGHFARKMNIWPKPEEVGRFISELKEKGSVHGWEQEFRKKSGEMIVAQLSAQLLSVRGETLILSTVVDITERKKMEEALRRSQAQYRLLVEGSSSVILRADKDLNITFMNGYGLDYFGYTAEELIGRNALGTIIPEKGGEGEDLAAMAGDLMRSPDRYATNVHQNRRKDGSLVWMSWANKPIYDESGNLVEILSIGNDLSRLKEAEKAVQESQHQIQEILESISDGFWAVDSQWRFIYMNQRAAENLGYKPSDLIGKSLWETFPDIEQSLHAVHYHKVMAERVPSQFEVEGMLTSHAYSLSVYPSGDGISVYWQDVTERKIAENKLKRSTERFALLSETASALLSSPNPQTVIEQLCRKVLAHLGCDVFFNFLLDENIQRLHLNACAGIPAEDLNKVEWIDFGVAVCGCVARDRKRIIVADIQHIPDPRTDLIKSFGIQAYCCHPLMAGNRVLGTLSFGSRRCDHFSDDEVELMRVVTDQVSVALERIRTEGALRELNAQLEQRVHDRTAALKNMTEALEAERKRFMDVLDVLPAYVILMSPDYHVPFANRFFEERFGKSLGRRCYEYLFNRTEPCEVCESFKPLKDNKPAKWEWTGPDGRIYDISDFPFTDTDGSRLILEMGMDITERKHAEAELEKHRHHLEELVKERTSQLSAANLLLQSEIVERKEAEVALQESEERFRLAIQHSKLMAWQCDGDLRFTWVYNSHFGVPGNDLLGKTPGDVGMEEGMADFIAHGNEVLTQGVGTRKTIKHVHTDGREQYFDQQVEALRDAQGHIVGLIGISLEVTERVLAEQRLHRSEESFRLMIGHSAEPMLLVDETGTIECISRKAADQLGFSEPDLVGSNVQRFLDWSGKLDLTMRLEDFLQHGPLPARAVLRVKTSKGTWYWIDVQASFINYGQKPEKYLLKFEVIDTEMKSNSQ